MALETLLEALVPTRDHDPIISHEQATSVGNRFRTVETAIGGLHSSLGQEFPDGILASAAGMSKQSSQAETHVFKLPDDNGNFAGVEFEAEEKPAASRRPEVGILSLVEKNTPEESVFEATTGQQLEAIPDEAALVDLREAVKAEVEISPARARRLTGLALYANLRRNFEIARSRIQERLGLAREELAAAEVGVVEAQNRLARARRTLEVTEEEQAELDEQAPMIDQLKARADSLDEQQRVA